MASFGRPFVTRAATAPAYWVGGSLFNVLATGVQTLNRFALVHRAVPKGVGSYTCVITQDQGFYALSGQCTFNVGSQHGLKVQAGDFISIPRYTQFSFTVDEPGTQLLNIITPAGPEQALVAVASPAVERGKLPAPELPMAPKAQFEAVNDQYGITPVEGIVGIDEFNPSRMITKDTMATTLKSFVANAKSSQSYWAINERWTVLASTQQTGGSYTFYEQLFPHGNVTPTLVYEKMDEMFYISDGQATFLLCDKTQQVGKGDFVYVPRGNPFGIRVDSETLSTITLDVPGGLIEALLPIMATPADKEGLPPPDVKYPQVSPDVPAAILDQLGSRAVAVGKPL